MRNEAERKQVEALQKTLKQLQAELDLSPEEFEKKLMAKIQGEVSQNRVVMQKELSTDVASQKAHLILRAVSACLQLILSSKKKSSAYSKRMHICSRKPRN